MKRNERVKDGIIQDVYGMPDIRDDLVGSVPLIRKRCNEDPEYKDYLIGKYYTNHCELTSGEKYVLSNDLGYRKKLGWNDTSSVSHYIPKPKDVVNTQLSPTNFIPLVYHSCYSHIFPVNETNNFNISELIDILRVNGFECGYFQKVYMEKDGKTYCGSEGIYYNQFKNLLAYVDTHIGSNFVVNYPRIYGFDARLMAFCFTLSKNGTSVRDFISRTEKNSGFATQWPSYDQYSISSNNPNLYFVNELELQQAQDMGWSYPDSIQISKRKILMSKPIVSRIANVK